MPTMPIAASQAHSATYLTLAKIVGPTTMDSINSAGRSMSAARYLHAHDGLRTNASPDTRWQGVQDLFSQNGVAWVTAGTAPRTRLDAVTVRTSVPQSLMADYIGERLFEEDPWIAHSSASTALDQMDMEHGHKTALTERCRRLHGVFADHGARRVCLVPAYSGARPGALVLYATGRDEAQAMRDPAHLSHLRHLSAIVAAHWRPEHDSLRQSSPATGAYMLNPVLAPREAEVLLWLAQGLQTAQIAHRMGIKPVTVGKHLRGASQKLGARTREQALALAIRDGLIHP